ncbi:hypothetical protein [Amycolatopsis sp. NPDC058986]|uniref:hypothetical protein n=1 Tax=unclassified Amycolatopsis TaxID=2618356 RepID=UPI0036724865
MTTTTDEISAEALGAAFSAAKNVAANTGQPVPIIGAARSLLEQYTITRRSDGSRPAAGELGAAFEGGLEYAIIDVGAPAGSLYSTAASHVLAGYLVLARTTEPDDRSSR